MDSALVRKNTTKMSSTPTEQMSPTLSAIMIDLAKAQPNSIFVVNLFQSNAIKLKCLAMQIDVAMNAEEEGERRHLLQKNVAHNCTRRPIHDYSVNKNTSRLLKHNSKMGRRGKSSFLFVIHDCVGELGEQQKNDLGLILPWLIFMLVVNFIV